MNSSAIESLPNSLLNCGPVGRCSGGLIALTAFRTRHYSVTPALSIPFAPHQSPDSVFLASSDPGKFWLSFSEI
jgi:hypothetical protein